MLLFQETRYDEFFDTPASIKNKTNKKQQEKPNVAENFDLSETQEASEEDTSSEEETEPDTKATEPCTSQQVPILNPIVFTVPPEGRQ